MRTSKSVSEVLFDSANVILLCLLSIVTLYPFLYVLFASISTPADFVQHRESCCGPRASRWIPIVWYLRTPILSEVT